MRHHVSDALEVLNPATEELVAVVPAATRDDVDAAVARAAAAQRSWAPGRPAAPGPRGGPQAPGGVGPEGEKGPGVV
ncbi:aldehyde dehydrogenase family protein, partial [Streptomyces virginiae]|uniref:aldehyde dehydrogenase family protein n=1 Tax=Streptomyces virginiae TaxID=1961 RepID=UPI0036BC7828